MKKQKQYVQPLIPSVKLPNSQARSGLVGPNFAVASIQSDRSPAPCIRFSGSCGQSQSPGVVFKSHRPNTTEKIVVSKKP